MDEHRDGHGFALYKHTQGLTWLQGGNALSPKKIPAFFKAELALPEDTEELNPPVRRERFPWGETLQEDKEDRLQELQHFHSKHQTPLGMASQDSLLLPRHPISLLDRTCGLVGGKKQEKIKVSLWHHGLPINSRSQGQR